MAFRLEVDLGDGSGKQVFEGETLEERDGKIAEAMANATRKIQSQDAELKNFRRQQLATPVETDPDGPIPEFRARQLTNDEMFALGQRLQNPATAAAALQEALEAGLGATLEQVRRTLRRAELTPRELRGREAAEIFLNNHPEYVPSQANSNELFSYMQKTGRYVNRSGERMALTVQNFEIAFDALSAAGLLQLRAPQAPAGAPANGGNGDGTPADSGGTPPGPTRPRFASTSTVTRTSGSPRTSGGSKMPTAEEIEKMSAAEHKKWLARPGFAEHEERLAREAAARTPSRR